MNVNIIENFIDNFYHKLQIVIFYSDVIRE